MDTHTLYVVDCPGEDGGKTAHYMPRWIATNDAEGPWSETASETVGGAHPTELLGSMTSENRGTNVDLRL